MGATYIWYAAIALEALIFWRGVVTPLLRRFPLFYLYLGTILAIEAARFVCYQFAPAHYRGLYWNSEVLAITVSYGVLIEILRSSLQHHHGMARLVQKSLLVVWVLCSSFAATDLLHGGLASVPRAVQELGRDLRYVEAAMLVVLLWFFGRYRISLGRNVLGMLLGYSFYFSLNVVGLALMSSPVSEAAAAMRKLLPMAYVATLAIWGVSLWSLAPEPAQPSIEALNNEYEILARRTRLILTRTSTLLARAIRP
jgi:hypothetical protein